LIIANEVQNQLQFDEIWFMPNQEPPHKENTSGVSGLQRSQMVQLAVADNTAFRLQTIELERPGRSFTYDTMKLLKEKYDHEFYFIIGADMIEYLPKWNHIDELVQLITFVGVNRPEYNEQTDYPIVYVDAPSIEISSLMIRNKVKAGKSIRYLVPESVRKYIEENHLYET
jgi:nicotinate-nucleotide adenylyltransferase